MRSYKLIAHTADIRFFLQGDSLEELYTAGFEALQFFLSKKNVNCSVCQYEKTIEVDGLDATDVLINFLSDVLTLSHIDHALYCKLIIEECSDTSVKARIFGISSSHVSEDIKAITYHEAQITRDDKGIFSTVVVCDI